MKKLFVGALGLMALTLGPVGGVQACVSVFCDSAPVKIWGGDNHWEQKTIKELYSEKDRTVHLDWQWDAATRNDLLSYVNAPGESSPAGMTLTLDYSGANTSATEEWSFKIGTQKFSLDSTKTSDSWELSDSLVARLINDSTYNYYGQSGNKKKADLFLVFDEAKQKIANEFTLKKAYLTLNCTPVTVPVPAAAPLFLGGLSLVGWAGRRRRQKAAPVS